MKYGKIVKRNDVDTVYTVINVNEDGSTYSGAMFYNEDGTLKDAGTVILEQKLKRIECPDDMKHPMSFYKFTDKTNYIHVYDELTADAKAAVAEQEVKRIRARRERECFAVINRGAPWYDRLTDTQKAELDAWYDAWLIAPTTRVIPDKPGWLE